MKKFLSIFFLFALLLLSSCSPKRYSTQYWGLFDTVVDVEGYFESEEEFKRADGLIYSTLAYYHELFNIYADSDTLINLKKVNESGGEPIRVERDLFEFIKYLKYTNDSTLGACNPALGAVSMLWKEAIADKTLPNEALLEEASRHCNMDTVILDEKSLTVTLTDPKLRLDAGAVAKGYVTGKLYETLKENGFDNILVNIGGNVLALGKKGDGKAWVAGVRDPLGNGYSKTLEICDTSLITSGGYERGAEIDGDYFHHIINPETLSPASGHLSVTVLSEDAALADMLSTALFVLSVEDGKELLKKFDSVEVLWIEPGGKQIKTENFPE